MQGTVLGCRSCFPGCFFKGSISLSFVELLEATRWEWGFFGQLWAIRNLCLWFAAGLQHFWPVSGEKFLLWEESDSFVRPESNQGMSPGSRSPEEKHIRFSSSGQEKPYWSRPGKGSFTVCLCNARMSLMLPKQQGDKLVSNLYLISWTSDISRGQASGACNPTRLRLH